jgi:methyltransferase-like protein 6
MEIKEELKQEITENTPPPPNPEFPSLLKYYEMSEEMTEKAKKIINEDVNTVKPFWVEKYEKDAKKNWDVFYRHNKNNFFKDRHYIDREFIELQQMADNKDRKYILCEMGCAVGNTIFPLCQSYKNIFCYGFDFSPNAIDILKESEEYKKNTDRIVVAVCDLVLDPIPVSFEKPDFCTLIFVLSAISPENQELVAKKVGEYVKPGGFLFLRDYGRYDMAQLKLASHKNAKINDNFYVKADGTRVYYFTKEEVRDLFTKVGFEEIENDYHYRLIENKKMDLKMNRVWLQARFVKKA